MRRLRNKRFLVILVSLVSVFLLVNVLPSFAEVSYVIDHGDFENYLSSAGSTIVGAPYNNYTGHYDVTNLTMAFNGLRTFVVFELYNNVSHNGYAFAFGRYGWYYFFTICTVSDGTFTRVYTDNSTVGFSDMWGAPTFFKNSTGDGFFGFESISGMINVTSYRLFCGGGSNWIEATGGFNPNVTGPYEYDPDCLGGNVHFTIDYTSVDVYSSPTPTAVPEVINPTNTDQFWHLLVCLVAVFVPALVCAVILGKFGFFAGLTIGAVAGYIALGALYVPVWVPIGVGLLDFLMVYQSSKGAI